VCSTKWSSEVGFIVIMKKASSKAGFVSAAGL